jgi:hypothetical protein
MIRLRGLLLSTVALGALAAVSSRPAHAQLAVFDSASFGQLVDEAQQGAQELTKLDTQIARLESIGSISQASYDQLTNFYNSFSHLDNATEVAPLLTQTSASFPLPELAQVEGLLRGQGFTGTLAAQSQQILSQIQMYRPTGTDFAATQMNTRAQATAGTMATAQTLFSSAEQRQQGMAQLMNNLATSTDPKQSLDLAARATIENGYAQTQANQAAALSILQRSQEEAEQEQAAQAWRQGADNLVEQATAAAAGGAGS